MLTPQEVQDKKFKQAFVGGYDMASVDDFLEALTQDYAQLYKENAVLKSKMKLLVGKVEEYRSSDDTIRQAYLAIKKQADEELQTAREEARRIVEDASGEAGSVKGKLSDQIKLEERRLAEAKEQTGAFVGALRELYASQMDKLSFIPLMEFVDTPKQRREEQMLSAALEIEHSVSEQIRAAEAEEEDESTQTFLLGAEEPASTGGAVTQEALEQKQEEILNSFEIKYPPGALGEYESFAQREDDTEIPRPKYEFPGIELQFGHGIDQQKTAKK